MSTLPELFQPFLVTVFIECAFVSGLLWRVAGDYTKTLFTVIAVHCLTHPFGATLYYFMSLPLLFVECAVTLLEGLAYRTFLVRSWPLALGMSVVANLASFYIGPIIRSML